MRLILLITCEVVVLFAIEFAIYTKNLSGRALGTVAVLNMALFLTAIILIIRKTIVKVAAEQALLGPAAYIAARAKQLQRGIKTYQRLMILFSIFLIFGELINWDTSPSIRISGAVFDLGLIALFYLSMRRRQAQLKELGETS